MGNYTVLLIVTDSSLATDTFTRNVFVAQPPVAVIDSNFITYKNKLITLIGNTYNIISYRLELATGR